MRFFAITPTLIALQLWAYSLTPLAADLNTQWISIQGRTYTAQLHNNTDRLKAQLGPHAAMVQGHYYEGHLAEIPDSWLRISERQGRWEGMVGLNGHIYALQTDTDGTLSRSQLNQTLSPLQQTDLTCAVNPLHTTALARPNDPLIRSAIHYDTLCSNLVNGICFIAELEIAFDHHFLALFPDTYTDEALNILNTLEGVIRDQLHIQFELLTMELLTSAVFAETTDLGVLLDDISQRNYSPIVRWS